MIGKNDLHAAVGAGILTYGQAAALTALVDCRCGARQDLAPGDELPKLFPGSNEIFIVLGSQPSPSLWSVSQPYS